MVCQFQFQQQMHQQGQQGFQKSGHKKRGRK
jgi:hypothetical protein